MRTSTIFFIVAAVILVIMAFAPQDSEAKFPRRKLHKLKKIAAVALLLKGKKKILFPLPLPLPLPIPHLRHHAPVHFPVAEPWAEPLAEPAYGHGYGHGHGFGHADFALGHGDLW